MVSLLRTRHLAPVLILIALPLIADAPLLLGLLHANPLIYASWLSTDYIPSPGRGSPGWYDPTIGQITQPLGMLSAHDWLHGIIPWWNPGSGLGMPLAAEMQPLAFFLPFVLLLHFWNGWLALKLILEMLCGVFTYALLIELGTTRTAALTSGTLYALNAAFFMVPHAMGPLPFAPLLLLGIERAARASRAGRPLGWGLIPLALAYLLYGGYPEIAYIAGLLGAVWSLRLFVLAGPARWRFAAKILLGAGIGLALSLPLIVPFLLYVGRSVLAQHGGVYRHLWLPFPAAPLSLLPFAYGPIWSFAASPAKLSLALTLALNQTGGWIGALTAALALAALAFRGSARGLALLLFGFIAIWEMRLWGNPLITHLINFIPAIAQTDAPRFAPPTLTLAAAIMAGVAVNAWQTQPSLTRLSRRTLIVAVSLAIALPLLITWPDLRAWFTANPALLPEAALASGAEILLAGFAIWLLTQTPTRTKRTLLALLVMIDLLGTRALEQLGADRGARIEGGGVRYLRSHLRATNRLGQRFYTLQPFEPNYAAAFGLASINDNALPVARNWSGYLHSKLDPYASVIQFDGSLPRTLNTTFNAHHIGPLQRRLLARNLAQLRSGQLVRPHKFITPPDQAAELRRHLAAYEAIGVRYILTKPAQNPFITRLPPAPAHRTAYALAPGRSLITSIQARLPGAGTIHAAALLIGTYLGAARGTLTLQLCAGANCQSGSAPLAHAQDNAYLIINLAHGLRLPTRQRLRVTITHAPGGTPVALWLAPMPQTGLARLAPSPGPGGNAPILRLIWLTISPKIVYQDRIMRIFALPHPAPFFTTSPACRLTAHGLNQLTAHCAAPASLLRREATDPGWHATRNGTNTPIGVRDGLLQTIALPAGISHIRFWYRPPYTRTSSAIALGALLLWLGLWWRGREPNRKPNRPTIAPTIDQ
jgi:hypothetical protein